MVDRQLPSEIQALVFGPDSRPVLAIVHDAVHVAPAPSSPAIVSIRHEAMAELLAFSDWWLREHREACNGRISCARP